MNFSFGKNISMIDCYLMLRCASWNLPFDIYYKNIISLNYVVNLQIFLSKTFDKKTYNNYAHVRHF